MRIFFSRWLELYALFRAAELPNVLQSSGISGSSPAHPRDVLSQHEQSIDHALEMLEQTSDANIEECLPQLGNMIVNMQNQPAALRESSSESVGSLILPTRKFTSFLKRARIIGKGYGNSHQYVSSMSIVSTYPTTITTYPSSVGYGETSERVYRGEAPYYDAVITSQHCLTFMRQGLEASLIRKCSRNPVIAMKFAWVLEDMAANSAELSERCTLLADICRKAGSNRLGNSELLSNQASNAVTFLEQVIHISREVGHLKFSKTASVKPELLSIVAKARIEWLNRNLLLNSAILGNLVPPSPGRTSKGGGGQISPSFDTFSNNMQATKTRSVSDQLNQLECLLTSPEHQDLVSRFSLPLLVVPGHQKALKVLKLVEEETLILNSASRAPIMITLELLECDNVSTLDCIVTQDIKQSLQCKPELAVGEIKKNQSHITSNDKPVVKQDEEIESDKTGICIDSCSLNAVNPSWLEELVRSQDRHRSLPEQEAIEVLWKGWGEIWSEKVKRIKASSKYGSLKGWRLGSFVVKEGDDLRKEKLAMQFIQLFQKIWQQHNVGVYVRPYEVMCCGPQCGLLENVVSARSLDSLKKNTGCIDLSHLFMLMFGNSEGLNVARDNFMRSLAAYSVISYILQVKDRHNGNILVDTSGHLIHIDYGFILGDSPGRNLGWERAPFKLTREFCEVIGEIGSNPWFEFEHLIVDSFVALQAHVDAIVQLALISLPDNEESNETVELLRLRIMTPPFEVRSLIAESVDNFFTKSYDMLQRQQHGIM